MLRRTLSRGALVAPIAARFQAPGAFGLRNLSNSSAALHETTPGDGPKTSLNREERVVRMDEFVRKVLKEGGSLPTPYLLVKEFGGARATATKVLTRIEEELKSNTSSPEGNPQIPTPAMKVDEPPSNIISSPKEPAEAPREKSKKAQEVQPTAAEAKQPVLSLWEKLHSIAYMKTSSPPASSLAPATSQSSSKPEARAKPKQHKDLLSSDSSDISESDSDDSSPPLSSNDPDGLKNPAQPLFKNDLQPRHGLYIKFLPPSVTESDLLNIFRSCGEIHRIQIVRGRNPTPKYVYAFVDFKCEEALRDALKKEVVVRGSKAMSEVANPPPLRERIPRHEEHEDGENGAKAKPPPAKTTTKNTNNNNSLVSQETASDATLSFSRSTLAVENIPHASLPQVVEALSQYGEIISSRAKQSLSGNITAYVEFKNEHEKDAALAASRVVFGGKLLKMARVDTPLTTVVRLSNIPVDAEVKIASFYKSYGKVEKVDTRMEGIVDIYYSENELKNMAKILEKLNALQMDKKKLRAIPAPVGYPKSVSSSPVGLKWIESQVELVTRNMNSSLKKSTMYSQDLQELLKLQTQVIPAAQN